MEMENLRDENSAWTGWLVTSPALAFVHLVRVRMIHTCLANGEGRELTNDDRPRRGQGEIVLDFITPLN